MQGLCTRADIIANENIRGESECCKDQRSRMDGNGIGIGKDATNGLPKEVTQIV